jgi:hypothetical protein
MEAVASSEVFLFEDFRLDRHGGGLFRRDDDGALTSQAPDFRLNQRHDIATGSTATRHGRHVCS